MKNSSMRLRVHLICQLGTALALAFHSGANADIVFSASFESPVVSGFKANTVPDNGNWIGSTKGAGANDRGLFNESFSWPDTETFNTPYGHQAYYIEYTNSGLTTAQGALGVNEEIIEGVTYVVSFNAALPAGVSSGKYHVQLVAFEASEDDVAREECRGARPGTMLAEVNAEFTTHDFSETVSFSYTPPAGDSSLTKDLGIRILKSTGEVLYDNIRLLIGHDFTPTPESGVTVPVGDVALSWTNRAANVGSDVWVDVWFGTDPEDLNKWTKEVDAGLNTTSVSVNAPEANTYYWRVDTYVEEDTTGTPVEGDLFSFVVDDTDGDGLTDEYELANATDPVSPTAHTDLDPNSDLDSDNLTAADEYFYGTDPNSDDTDDDTLLDGPELSGVGSRPATSPVDSDSDDDGLSDGVESNTGTWASASDTGTDPTKSDTDEDGIIDGRETNTGVLVDRFNTGTDPFNPDTDGDLVGDYYEVNASFTNPFDNNDRPPFDYPLPDPAAASDTTTSEGPIKVYIMAGQSNMVGIGYTDGINAPGSLDNITKAAHRFPNLVDGSNNYTTRQDVYYRGVVTAIGNGPLTKGQFSGGNRVGVELGFGHIIGTYHDEPVLLLKASQGNRSLGWDFLPPGSTQYTISTTVDNETINTNYAGYGESPQSWLGGTTPAPAQTWYAGKQYDECFRNEADMGRLEAWEDGFDYTRTKDNGERIGDYLIKHNGVMYLSIVSQSQIDNNVTAHISDPSTEPGVGAHWQEYWKVYEIENTYDVLANFESEYPQWAGRGYEIAGFVWWQGHKDGGEKGTDSSNPEVYATKYEENLSSLIDSLRTEFNAPNAPFVVATIGFGGGVWAANSSGDLIWNAQMAVGDSTQHPEYNGTVASVDTTPYWRELDESPGEQGFHYNNNAETYTLVGDALARSMVELLETDTPPFPNPMTFKIEPSAINATTVGMVATVAEATTLSGEVEYYFEETSGNPEGNDSGWQTSTSYTDYNLTGGLTYSYRVKTRDTNNGLESESSNTVTVTAQTDNTPPDPDPLSFETLPATLGENSITMTAEAALDINGPVEYFFTCTTDAAHNSDWQTSRTYTPTGLTDSTEYFFTVKARDSQGNETAASVAASDTTDAPDSTPPNPDPMTFATGGEPTALGENSITMTATTATDDSQVEYYFECTNDAAFSSDWQDETTYVAIGLAPGTEYTFRVRAQDKSPTQNPTGYSAPISTTTDAPDLTAPAISLLDPSDEASGIPIDSDLVITFDEDVKIGTGLVTIKNLTDGSQSTIDITDGSQVSLSGAVLTINPTSNLLQSKDYAVQIADTAIDDLVDNSFAGISDDTTWNFATEEPPPPGLKLSDDFENPEVTVADSDTDTSKNVDTTKWVRADGNFKGHHNGIEDEGAGRFTDPVGQQAYRFSYTNSGLTSAPEVIGALTTGTTYTVTFDVVRNDGADSPGNLDYNAGLVTFVADTDRTNVRTLDDSVSAVLNSVSGGASDDGLYMEVTLEYTADGTEATLGQDVALRFAGTTDCAIIDNVQVTTSVENIDTTPPAISTLSPTDGATGVVVASNFVVTFNEDIAAGTGLITLKNLSDATASTIEITDGTQVSIAGTELTLNPSIDLAKGKQYAVQIAATAIKDSSDNAFAGITADTVWNFSTIAASFADWISGYNVGGQTALDDDYDGDGVSNAAENYFGTNPESFSAGLAAKQVNTAETTTFKFSHPISDTPAPDLTASYRWSKDLSTFYADGLPDPDETTVSFSVAPPANGEVEVTATVSGTETDRVFVDVEVTPNN